MKYTPKFSLTYILTSAFLIAGLLAVVPMQSYAQEADTSVTMEAPENIVSALESEAGFSTLTDALQKTGLLASLEADGPFTVFAPTDRAFEAVDLGAMDEEQLKSVLQYHVVSGAMDADQVAEEGTLTSLHGGTLSVSDGMVNGTAAITTSIETENGIIHVIDAVLTPAQSSSI